MTNYQPAHDDHVDLLNRTMAKYHPHLVKAEVRVSLLAAYARIDDEGNETGPALKHHGYPALAKARIVPHRDRVQGLADAEVTIDGNRFALLSQDEQIALLDHELEHLELVLDDEGRIKSDDGGRPRLKCKLHDYRIEGFDSVAKRHGKHSQEVQQYRACFDERGQAYFDFLEQPAEVEA